MLSLRAPTALQHLETWHYQEGKDLCSGNLEWAEQYPLELCPLQMTDVCSSNYHVWKRQAIVRI